MMASIVSGLARLGVPMAEKGRIQSTLLKQVPMTVKDVRKVPEIGCRFEMEFES